MQAARQGDGPLEAKLRGLILNNSETTASPREPSPLVNNQPDTIKGPPKTSRKRLNQTQRREMSTQLNIPIDTRPAQPQPQPRQPHPMNSRGNYPATQPFNFGPSPTNAGFPASPHYPSHSARHQPSPSYPGHAPPPGFSGWNQGRGARGGFTRGQHGSMPPMGHPHRNSRGNHHQALYNPHEDQIRPEDLSHQVALLEDLCSGVIAKDEIELQQIAEKEQFRIQIEQVCRDVITQHETITTGRVDFPPLSVQLRCFGSLASGFATKSADMDLGLLTPFSHPQPDSHESPIPRLIEKAFLDLGLGARLLTKTRVPIIKLCEKPPPKLYADMVEKRTEWEKGIGEEDDVDDDEPTPIDKPDSTTELRPRNAHSSGATDNKEEDSYRELLDKLKQGEKMSLTTYYDMTKKVLRKLGGRDITNATATTLQDVDFRVLNDVCRAFIRGLADQALKFRLTAYPSLSFDQSSPRELHRSLSGVLTQVEGEKMAMAWESREIREKDARQEQLGEKRILHWKNLQNMPAGDPLAYNKELASAADYLMRCPSIELLHLRQEQHESASQYHSRTIKLMVNLGGHDLVSPNYSPILSSVIRQFINGIHNHEIRARVAEFREYVGSPSLRAVARRHKSLQLAHEFEKVVDEMYYPAHCLDDIRSYVELLRSPMVPRDPFDAHFDYVVPMTPESWSLLAKISDLSQPSYMSPNQARDRYRDPLEIPKSGVGVQCDINFAAQLGLQNTRLLRCYSRTDSRVKPLVLFVKHWAKVRGINTAYRGTLSSYGYVLMVLHYLVNVARPTVCPNLQDMAPPVNPNLTAEQIEETVTCKGRDIRFWRDENEITRLASEGVLTQNRESIGHLLRGFFEYYAHSNMMSTGQMRGFDWGRDVISLRTHGGLLSKQQKGWTGAKTVIEIQNNTAAPPPAAEPAMLQANPKSPTEEQNDGQPSPAIPSPASPTVTKLTQERATTNEVKEIRLRFLFAIEDPFELDHNVARTVVHHGIVKIRDEFRRAWRIIKLAGKQPTQENLLQDASEDHGARRENYLELLDEIHGRKRV